MAADVLVFHISANSAWLLSYFIFALIDVDSLAGSSLQPLSVFKLQSDAMPLPRSALPASNGGASRQAFVDPFSTVASGLYAAQQIMVVTHDITCYREAFEI